MSQRKSKKDPPPMMRDLSEKVRRILGAYPNGSRDHFTIDSYTDSFNLKHLLELCAVLECSPEQLFWNPDLDHSGCYYEGDTPSIQLVFEVRR